MEPTPGSAPEEILPGLFHFTQLHTNIGLKVDSYYLYAERVLIDPMVPAGGIDWFAEHEQGPPTDILLSCRHHYRHSDDYVERFNTKVHCVSAGMHEFGEGRQVESFEFGDELPGGVTAIEIGALSPDEGSFLIPAFDALLCSDGVVSFEQGGPLGFVPDQFMDDPAATKKGLIEAYRKLLGLDFTNLLLAHGGPVMGNGKEKLRQFVEAAKP